MNQLHQIMTVAALSALLAGPVSAAPVAAPYSENFDDGIAQDFTQTTVSSTWSFTSGTYDARTAGNTATAFSMLQVSNLGLANHADFTLTSTANFFSATSPAASDTWGFAVLANNPALSGGAANPYYLIDVSRAGSLRILEIAGSNSTLASGSLGGQVNIGTTLSLTVQGDYTGSDLVLSFTVTGGSTSPVTITTASQAAPLTGQYFGYRQRSGGGDFHIRYDDFSITTIPEPATLALLGLGGLAMCFRGRGPGRDR